MKHYQRKKIKLIDYVLYSIGPILFSALVLFYIFSGNFSDEIVWRILGIITFGFFAVYGYMGLINLFLESKCRGTIEIDDNGVIYKSRKNTVKLRWLDIKEVSIHMGSYFNFSGVVVFYVKGYSSVFWSNKISKKRVWANLTDDMVDDIIKYWGGLENVGAYNKYKRIADKFNLR